MSRLVPPVGVGLTAAGLAAALLCAPSLAYADPSASATSSPTSKASATSKEAATPTSSPSAKATATSTPKATATPTPSPSAKTTATSTSSPSAKTTGSGEASESPTSSPEPTAEASSPGSTPAQTAKPDGSPSPSAGGNSGAQDDPSASDESAADAPSGAGPGSDARSLSVAGEAIQAQQAEQPEVAAQAEEPEQADIALTKTASPGQVSKVGQVITYRFVATNTGSIDLTNVAITDELEGLSALKCDQSGTAATLAPKEALHCTATLTVTQAVLDFGDIDNFATVFGEYDIEGQGDYVGANAAAHVSVAQRPSIALSASVSPRGKADRGDRLRYTATATNTGNVTLTSARIVSNLAALDLSCQPAARATLAPGASLSCAGNYRVSRADARHGRVNATLTARAERPYGDSGDSSDDVTDSSTLRVAVTKPASTGGHNGSTGDSSTTGSSLADTGSPDGSLPVGLLGVVLTATGIGLVRRGRRR